MRVYGVKRGDKVDCGHGDCDRLFKGGCKNTVRARRKAARAEGKSVAKEGA